MLELSSKDATLDSTSIEDVRCPVACEEVEEGRGEECEIEDDRECVDDDKRKDDDNGCDGEDGEDSGDIEAFTPVATIPCVVIISPVMGLIGNVFTRISWRLGGMSLLDSILGVVVSAMTSRMMRLFSITL